MSTSAEPTRISLTRSQYAERLIVWEHKPLSLTDYPMFRAPYDGGHKRVVLKTSRQVGKTIKLMAELITDSVATEDFKSLYVSPSEKQTQDFSALKLGKAIHFSPLVRDFFVDSSMPNKVLTRAFRNGSQIVLTYACDDGDRVRGNSADHVLFDETQDVLLDAVRPEIRECLRNSKIRRESYCGTPKTLENGLEHLWKNSTQTEWVIKCDSCGRYSIVVSETQLGKWGPICGACKAYLNPRNGYWQDTNPKPLLPTNLANLDDDDADITNDYVRYKGYHISRPIMLRGVPAAWPEGPLRDEAKSEWREILDTLEGADAYPLPKFRNEVLGIADSVGTRLVAESDLLALCDGPPSSDTPTAEGIKDVTRVAAGIDWSGGGRGGHSTTVLVILGRLTNGKHRVLYYKIWAGVHAVQENEEIRKVIANYAARYQLLVGGDAGEGNSNMDMIRESVRNPERVVKFRYSGTARAYVAWDKVANEYTVRRTVAIDSAMMAFLRKEVQFPASGIPALRGGPFKHILAEYEESTSKEGAGVKVWRHAETDPDDFLHAFVFARLALQISNNEINLGAAPPQG